MANAFILAVSKNSTDCPVTFSPDMSEEAADKAAVKLYKTWVNTGFQCSVLVLDTGRPLEAPVPPLNQVRTG